MNFDNKIILVVGGTSGIGAACVHEFARTNATVIFCSNDRENGNKIVNELDGRNIVFLFCDVSIEDDIKSVISYIETVHDGKLNCLINNVGTHPEDRKIDDFTSSDLDFLFSINVKSHFLFSKYSMPMLRKYHGCIINMSSQVGSIGQRNAVTYAITKGAVTAMTKSLALDEAENGVRVNCISPGIINTPLLVQNTIDNCRIKGGLSYENEIEKMKKLIPLGDLGDPVDVAHACMFLASDMARHITGADIPVSGGAEIGYGIKFTK